MKARYLNNCPKIHTVPLETIHFDQKSAYIEFDDVDEIRWIMHIKTILAWRCTGWDFFDVGKMINDVEKNDEKFARYPIIFEESSWLEDLKKIEEPDYSIEFQHILLILGDHILELMIGDNYKIEKM